MDRRRRRKILRTADGGENWSHPTYPATDRFNSTVDLNAVDSPSNDQAWAVGDDGLILHTSDGGKKWVHQESYTHHSLWGVEALDKRIAFAVGNASTIVRTLDGVNWDQISLFDSDLGYRPNVTLMAVGAFWKL